MGWNEGEARAAKINVVTSRLGTKVEGTTCVAVFTVD